MRTVLIVSMWLLATVAFASVETDTSALIQKFTAAADNEFSAQAAVMAKLAAQGGTERLIELLENTIVQLRDAKRISTQGTVAEDLRMQNVITSLQQDVDVVDTALSQLQEQLEAARSAHGTAVADLNTREEKRVTLNGQLKALADKCSASADAHDAKVHQFHRVISEADQMRALLVRVREMVRKSGVVHSCQCADDVHGVLQRGRCDCGSELDIDDDDHLVSNLIEAEAAGMQTAAIKSLARSTASMAAMIQHRHGDAAGDTNDHDDDAQDEMLTLLDNMITKVDAQQTLARTDLSKQHTFYATVSTACKDQQALLAVTVQRNDQAVVTAKGNIAAANTKIAQILAQININKANRVSKMTQQAATQTQRQSQQRSEVTKQANYDAQIQAVQAIIDYVHANKGKLNANVDGVDVPLPGRFVLGDWSACSADCGHGQQTRTVSCHGGRCSKPAPLTSQACKLRECPVNCVMSAWSPWSVCDKPCDTGSQTQTRTVMTPAAFGGTPCPAYLQQVQPCNVAPCPQDCKVSDWSAPSACTKTCDGGQATQTRMVLSSSAHGGAPCPVLTQMVTCNTDACPSRPDVEVD